MGRREHDDQLVLGPVGVLVLVDQHVLEALLVVRQHVGQAWNRLTVTQQQVVEVHGAGGQQPALVLPVDLGDRGARDGLRRSSGVGLEVDQLVFGRGDDGVNGPGRELLAVDVEVPEDVAGEADGVGLVVDGER